MFIIETCVFDFFELKCIGMICELLVGIFTKQWNVIGNNVYSHLLGLAIKFDVCVTVDWSLNRSRE